MRSHQAPAQLRAIVVDTGWAAPKALTCLSYLLGAGFAQRVSGGKWLDGEGRAGATPQMDLAMTDWLLRPFCSICSCDASKHRRGLKDSLNHWSQEAAGGPN
jgi:hypothetical protein